MKPGKKQWRMPPVDRAEWVTEYWQHFGPCTLCRRATLKRGDMVGDHCHVTGMMRAAICRRCNGFLGHMETAGKTDAEMHALMLSKGVKKDISGTIRRMRTYIKFWQLRTEPFAALLKKYGMEGAKGGNPGYEAEWVLACGRAGVQYKRWLRRTYGLKTYHLACWMDDKPHTHTLARRTREMLRAEALPTNTDQ